MAFGFMVLIAMLFTALGTAIACSLTDMQGFQMVMNFLVMPIFFLSGALFPLTDMPAVMEFFATLDPLSYGVDGAARRADRLSHFGGLTRSRGAQRRRRCSSWHRRAGNFRGSRPDRSGANSQRRRASKRCSMPPSG